MNSTEKYSQFIIDKDDSNTNFISKKTINISGGPAFPYNYQLHQTILHFGHASTSQAQKQKFVEHHQRYGSEHTIDQIRFPAEVIFLTC